MAQPLFDEHPLEDYFRESGQDSDIMPGGNLAFATELSDNLSSLFLPYTSFPFFVRIVQLVRPYFPSSRSTAAFAERFKYSVISSSLLATAVSSSTLPTHHRTFSPHIPGKLNLVSADDIHVSVTHASPILDSFADSHWPLTLTCMAAVAFITGNLILFLLLASSTLIIFHISSVNKILRPETVSASFDALDDLVTAGNVWDSTVNEAITILENEERSIFYGPTSASSPSTTLRVALQSSLHTSQNQCDNIRQLLTALTAPSELAPLSEMYAPPSLIKSPSHQKTIRPKSLPDVRQWTMSTPSDKRATWNGSYAALAQAESPSMQMFKRREKRRSDLSSLLEARAATVTSAPVTPHQGSLQGVVEEALELGSQSTTTPEPTYAADDETFGVAALDLRRKHRSSGLESFGRSDYDSRQTISSSSPFTLMQTSRHPLSLSALNLALQGALAAKRYTCSHLLALRFDEEDEYWEDVRSVIALLTSSLTDASSRLMEALDDAEKRRMKDEVPSSTSGSRASSIEPPSPLASRMHIRSSSWSSVGKERKRFRTVEHMVSFAPVPSTLARFAAHVDALSSALNDARDNLEQCISSLRANGITKGVSGPELGLSDSPSVALESYDRLRKELGLALRECERGREQLLEVVNGGHKGEPDEDVPSSRHESNVLALRRDTGIDESEDRLPELAVPFPSEYFVSGAAGGTSEDDVYPDDVTAHLLLTASSHHLPPVGVEQVFEAEPPPLDTGTRFTRERSKLTRQERIALSRADREKRESSGASPHYHPVDGQTAAGRARTGLGPGGEVVQELKDVIWKVGERRRKMAEQLLSPSVSADEGPVPPRRIPSPFTRLDSS